MSAETVEDDGAGGGVFTEEEANRKRQKKEHGKALINQAVDQAKRLIINHQIEDANRLVYDKMTGTIRNKVFMEDSIELLPAYFVLAEANICHGGSRLKKAEEFLIAAYWNLLKYTSEENEKGSGGSDDSLVSKKEIEQYRACLHKTFGRLFLAQTRPETHKKALEELSQGIFLECTEHGPESIYLCSSYFYMGQLFQKENQMQKARSFYQKIVTIWKKFITEKDMNQQAQPEATVDQFYYLEAFQHMEVIKSFFENQYDPENISTAEAYLSFGLICLKTGDFNSCVEYLQKALVVYQNQLGEFDFKTKEVENILNSFEQNMQQQQSAPPHTLPAAPPQQQQQQQQYQM